MSNVNNRVMSSFKGQLKRILDLELKKGNNICETYQGDWPTKNCTMIFLEKPFLTPIQRNIAGVTFRNVNDPHYWKAEYYDKETNQFLCCCFGKIPDYEDMLTD